MLWRTVILAMFVLLAAGCERDAGAVEAKGDLMIRVKVFNDAGELVGPVEMPKVVKTEEQWRAQLTEERYRILRRKGTEPAFCGTLLDNKKVGVYSCAGCGLPLFSSDAKFNSGTGWPSFFQPIAAENIAEARDTSYGMVRTEILCVRCDGHLGHVFEDGPRPTGLRYCVNGESLVFTPSEEVAKLADPAVAGNSPSPQPSASEGRGSESALKTAVLAGGCFWCTEAVFEQLEGVTDVTSGYAGGTAETADYDTVCTGTTDHAEAIRITYDPAKISYEQLLKVFFTVAHDPTQLNRQGNDVGRQYRSAVFYADESEKAAAERMIQQLTDEKHFRDPIVTTLEPLTGFYPAERYHQDYARQNPDQPYIRAIAQPKVEKVRDKFADQVKPEAVR